MAIKHTFVSTETDSTDTSLVRKTEWNADHTLENDTVTYAKMQNVSATDKILGRSTAGAGDVEEIACTPFARSIIDDADEAAFKATVNLEAGVDVQAYDAELAAIAGLVSAADKGIQFTGIGTAATYDLTTAGKALLDDADAAAQLVTLGLTATAAELNVLDGITPTVTELNYTNGVTSAIQTQLNGKQASLGYTPENTANKDATGGYTGLTLFKINFKNALNTIISFFTNANTAARTYTFQDRDGTIADDTDLATKQNTLTNSADLAAALSDETGTGLAVFNTSPTLVTPVLGAASGTSLSLSGLTASEILGTDASKNLASLPVATYPSLAELVHVKGVTSAIQTQLDLKAPLASPTFTGTVTVPTPSNATDAATKAYTDSIVSGLDIKASVRVASTVDIAIASALINGSTIDGVVVATGDRALLKDQTAGAENGIYVVVASGAASRAADADSSAKVTSGMYVFVSEGTVSSDMGYVLTTNDPITLETTALTFTQFSGAGQIIAGDGLSKSANTLLIDTAITVDKTTAQTLTNKTLTSPAIANIAPAANFTLTQNAVTPFTSIEAGAVANTLVLKEGNVGIGASPEGARLEVPPSSGGIAIKIGRTSGNPSIRGISDTDWLIVDAGTSGKLGLNFWSTGDVVLANGGGNVAVGLITSGSKLQVAGNVAIGYSASTAGPTNGLVISGKVGVGITIPMAVLHLKAGTATAGTAPLKLTSGTLNTTPEEGAIEFDGTNLYFVDSTGTRKQLAVV